MNAIKYINKVFFILLSLAFVAGCDDDNTSDLQLNGQTWLNTLQLDEYQGVIDNSTKTINILCKNLSPEDVLTNTFIVILPVPSVSVPMS